MPNGPPAPADISFLGLGRLALQATHDLPKAKVWPAQNLFGGHACAAFLSSADLEGGQWRETIRVKIFQVPVLSSCHPGSPAALILVKRKTAAIVFWERGLLASTAQTLLSQRSLPPFQGLSCWFFQGQFSLALSPTTSLP